MSFVASAVTIDAASTNCSLETPLRLCLSYTAPSACSYRWQCVFLADVASANWCTPVFGPTEAVRSGHKGMEGDNEAGTVRWSIRESVNTAAELMGYEDGAGSSPVLGRARNVDDEEAMPAFTTAAAQPLDNESGPSSRHVSLHELSVTVDNTMALYSAIPVKYLLQVGLLQLVCFESTTQARVGEVNIVCQMKKASAHGLTARPDTLSDLSPPLSSLTRYLYSPTA